MVLRIALQDSLVRRTWISLTVMTNEHNWCKNRQCFRDFDIALPVSIKCLIEMVDNERCSLKDECFVNMTYRYRRYVLPIYNTGNEYLGTF